MSRLFELGFSVESDALLAKKIDEVLFLPETYVTVVSGIALEWKICVYPRGTRYISERRSDDFNFGFTLISPVAIRKKMSIKMQFQVKDGNYYPVFGPQDLSKFRNPTNTMCVQEPGMLETLIPGSRLSGRVLLLLDPADVSLAFVAQSKVDAVKKFDYGPVVRGMYEAALGGDEAIGDTRIVCRDGVIRAVGNILRFQSAYFAKLFEFKHLTEKSGLRVDFSDHGVAAVGALLKLIHTNALPVLDDLSASDLLELLELGAQVAPEGLDLLKASVEKSLMSREPEDVKTLGATAMLADVHGLDLLANVTHVRLAQDAFVKYKAIWASVDDEIWTKVFRIAEKRVEGIEYTLKAGDE